MNESDEIKSRVSSTTEMFSSTLSSLDFVIEAVSENPSLKAIIFKQLAAECPSHAILATNTSSIGITKIASAAVGAQDRVIGMHFMVRKIQEIDFLLTIYFLESRPCNERCRNHYWTTNFR